MSTGMPVLLRTAAVGIAASLLALPALALPSAASAEPRAVVPSLVTSVTPGRAPDRTASAIIGAELAVVRGRQAASLRQSGIARAITAAINRTLRLRVVKVARQQLGDRYSAGSAGPNAFDCSGLTLYVYRVATGKRLPHQSHAQYARVKKISKKHARPGDLVFFFRNGAHHVGIYIGRGRMIDAPGHGHRVRISPISGSWWSRSYTGMGRVLPA